ncbi:enoyl-CoA hydratase-related protein [Paenarthrobacter nitroguajacolicus]|uniref:enoyl-CoA hydratase/isomerase family protein n=1 Tax=Paenarthrobacter nitroguajacolicus TaxID=211146 RepID=UPI003D1BD95D
MTTAAPTRTILSERTVFNRRFAILEFQPPAGTLTTWSAPALDQLAEALWSLDTARLDAVVFHGTGRVFGAGADLDEFRTSTRLADGAAIATRGYDVFDAISRLNVPTVAVIQGPALGGALELALRADYRVAASSVKALGLPEVRLGLVPGWGGLTSLARLIGPARTKHIAVTNALLGKHLTAAAALKEGIVDVVLDDEDLLEAALHWTSDLLNRTPRSGRALRNPVQQPPSGTPATPSRPQPPSPTSWHAGNRNVLQQSPYGSPATAQTSASLQGRTRSATTPLQPLPRCCNRTKAARASMPLTSCRKPAKTTGPAPTWNQPASVWSEAG